MYEKVGKMMAASFLLLGIGIATAGITNNPDTTPALQKPIKTDEVVGNPETMSQSFPEKPRQSSKNWRRENQRKL